MQNLLYSQKVFDLLSLIIYCFVSLFVCFFISFQGALFSIIASVESLAAVAGSAVWSYIFPLTLDRNMRPGTTFMLIAAIGYAVVPVMM